ncbi:MAG: Holliday junction branch migration protein RuvA [Pseudomonadota bacterium]
MIGCLQGCIAKIKSDYLLLNVGSVGYKLFCARHLLETLQIGDRAFFYVETAVGDDYIKLYGFESEAAQNWFLTLGSVQGVGAKAAFAILSAASLNDISDGVMFGDRTIFTKAQGVGPKLAERIVNELKNKKDLPPTFSEEDDISFQPATQKTVEVSAPIVEKEISPQKAHKTPSKESANKRKMIETATSALMNLGYTRQDAMKAAIDTFHNEAPANENDLIHAALKYIGQMKEVL